MDSYRLTEQIQTTTTKTGSEVTLIRQQTIKTGSEVDILRQQVAEVLRLQESMQYAIDAISGQNGLLQFLTEYSSKRP